MPFGTIVVNTKSYAPRVPGDYMLSTVLFGQPQNMFRIRGGSVGKDGLLRTSVSRVLEKDTTVNSAVIRKGCTVTLTVTVPASDFTAADVDSLASDISEFLTTDTITRIMQGES